MKSIATASPRSEAKGGGGKKPGLNFNGWDVIRSIISTFLGIAVGYLARAGLGLGVISAIVLCSLTIGVMLQVLEMFKPTPT